MLVWLLLVEGLCKLTAPLSDMSMTLLHDCKESVMPLVAGPC